MTRANFLLARIAEDWHNASDCDCWPCGRRRATCAAMWRIAKMHTPDLRLHSDTVPQDCPLCCHDYAPDELYPCPTLRHLAAIYADHPDYGGEWLP